MTQEDNLAQPLIINTTSPLPSGATGSVYNHGFMANGGTAPYKWSISAGNLPLGLSLTGDGLICGTPSTAATAPFTVKVTDNKGLSATRDYQLAIASTPEPLQILRLSFWEYATVGAAYLSDYAIEARGGIKPYKWSISSGSLPSGLTLSRGGVISGTPGTVGLSKFVLTVTDNNGSFASEQFNMRVSRVPIISTYRILPNGVVGIPYTRQLAAIGGKPPYTWVENLSTYPCLDTVGLRLTPDAVISGTPTVAMDTFAIVTVKDSDNLKSNLIFQLTVVPQGTPIIETPNPLPRGTMGNPYAILLSAKGGRKPYEFRIDSGSLPLGLDISDSVSGLISGTLSAEMVEWFTLRVTDAQGLSSAQRFLLIIEENQR